MRRITDPILDDTVYFRSDRVYYQAAITSKEQEESTEAGWYISMRGGYAYGPFPDREVAEAILDGLLKKLRKRNIEEALGKRSA